MITTINEFKKLNENMNVRLSGSDVLYFDFENLKLSLNVRIFKPLKKWFIMTYEFKGFRHTIKIRDNYGKFMTTIKNFIDSELDEPIGYILIDILLNNIKRTIDKNSYLQDFLNLSREDYFKKHILPIEAQDIEYNKVQKTIQNYNDLIVELENIKQNESDKFLADLGVNIEY